MPKLPDVMSLPQATPQSSYGIIPVRNTAAIEGIAAIGKGLSDISTGIDRMEYQKGAVESAFAKSAFLAKQMDVEQEILQEPDYTKWEDIYRQKMGDVMAKSQGMVNNQYHATRTKSDLDNLFLSGVSQIKGRVHSAAVDDNVAKTGSLLEQNRLLLQRTTDATQRTAIIDSVNEAISNNAFLTERQKFKFRDDFVSGAARDYGLALVINDPVRAQSVLMPMQGWQSLDDRSKAAIQEASAKHGVSANLLERTATMESGGNILAQSSTGAKGLFQFTEGTARQYGLADPNDPIQSADAAARLAKDNASALREKLGREPLDSELYLAHQQGAGGAAALLGNEEGKAIDALLPVYADKERAKQAILVNGGKEDMSAKDFVGLWKNRYEAGSKSEMDFKLTGTLIDQLPLDERFALSQKAKSLVSQQETIFRSNVDDAVKNHTAMAMAGETIPNELPREQFVSAYGSDGNDRYRAYANAIEFGKNYNSALLATPEQQVEILREYNNLPEQDFDQKNRYREILFNAVQKANDSRAKDPMFFAVKNKIASGEPLAFNDVGKLSGQLKSRESVASSFSEKFKVPQRIFTNDEAEGISNSLQGMPAEGKLAIFGALRNSLSPTAYSTAIQQIRPDSPVTAMAGIILGKDKELDIDKKYTPMQVAAYAVRGEDLINPSKAAKKEDGTGKEFVLPKQSEMRAAFEGHVATAFRDNPISSNNSYQLYTALYAALASERGVFSGQLDNKASNAALKMAVNVGSVGNSDTILPWGEDESDFRDKAFEAFKAIRPNENFDLNDFDLIATGKDGAYVLKTGSGYLLDKKGKPLILDVYKKSAGEAMDYSVMEKIVNDRK